DNGASDVVRGQEDERGAAYLELLDGSSWTMSIKTISMEETDFYPLDPDALKANNWVEQRERGKTVPGGTEEDPEQRVEMRSNDSLYGETNYDASSLELSVGQIAKRRSQT
ncbi:hypothetical protein DL93DRAFT_2103862, partial [Clavulina sp. PMI_390]